MRHIENSPKGAVAAVRELSAYLHFVWCVKTSEPMCRDIVDKQKGHSLVGLAGVQLQASDGREPRLVTGGSRTVLPFIWFE